ncbi:hypothetical protein JJJ17_02930 [Paracoccus caeni]|uniref:Uncharacterized protein n=1 Tax=Paracoccus caeni TaxID=657651 RepID=A0A934VZJ0_9RHOB|nr:hypothetical protein [Paracoccus caeni]MBK4214874.1 hypothetical protein [Paracoccus caeni]
MATAGSTKGRGRNKRRLIVHLGVQKTGSTGIQRHLHRNAAALADRLILRTPDEGSPMRPLGRAAVHYSLKPSNDSATALAIAFEAVLADLPGNDLPVLLSHENLAGAMPGNGGEIALYPALPNILQIILKSASGFSTDFVVYTRNMARWKASVWAQAVRTDGYTRPEDQFLNETAAMPGWGDLMRRLSEVAGSDRVTRFKLEDEAQDGHPGRQLLRHAGLDDASIDALEALDGQANRRLSQSSTEFLRRLNGMALNPHARGKVVDLVARNQHLFTADAPSEGTL